MKFLYQFLVLSVFFTQSILAQGAPKLVKDGAISIDGDTSDWSGVDKLKDVLTAGAAADFVDVKTAKLAYDTQNFYFLFDFNKEIGKWKPKNDLDVFQIYFDVDANQNTGSSKLKAYEAKIMGYEYRLEYKIQKSGKPTIKLFSKASSFNKEIANLSDKADVYSADGKAIEFKLSLEELNVPNEGQTKVRFLFAEFANSKKSEGYMKVTYALNFKSKAEETKSSGADTEGSSEPSGFGIFHLMVITIWIVSMLCAFAIAPKAGLSSGLAMINIIPFFGQLAFLFILAFNKWPLHDDYNALEERLKEFEEN